MSDRISVGIALCALVAGCGSDCPDGYRKQSDKCVADRMADAVVGSNTNDAGARESTRDHGDDDSGGKGGATQPNVGGTGGVGGTSGAPAADGGSASDRTARTGAGGANAGHDSSAGMTDPAADGGGGGPVAGQASPPDPPPRGAGIGSSFLFWRSGTVTYPFAGTSLLRSERLTGGQYLVTGKLNITNATQSALDVLCSVGLNEALDMESLSVPPADTGPSTISVLLACLGPTGASVDSQRAFLTCTCSSGDACRGLKLDGIGIITKLVAADSGTVALTAPAGT